MLLDKSFRKLEIVLAAVKTTNDCHFSAVYQDVFRDATVPGVLSLGVTNGPVVVTAVQVPPDNTAREITEVFVYNFDTAAVTVIVQYNDNGTVRIVKKSTLNAGQTLTYQAEFGWTVN